MFAVFRIKVEEYVPGHGWKDDGAIYSLDKLGLENEASRRKTTSYLNQERIKVGSVEIVKVHESFLRDLRTSPILCTISGLHPADEGTLAEHKETFQHMRTLKYPGKNSSPSVAR